MKTVCYLLAGLLILGSCASQTGYLDTTSKVAVETSHSAKPVLDSFAEFLREKGIVPVSSGVTKVRVGMAKKNRRYKIESFYQMGNVSKDLDVESTRRMLVDSVQELLKRINEDKEIRGDLLAYPVSSSRVHFSMLLTDGRGSFISGDKKVAKASLQDGLIRYYTYAPGEEEDAENFVFLAQELYEEALSEIERETAALSRSSGVEG